MRLILICLLASALAAPAGAGEKACPMVVEARLEPATDGAVLHLRNESRSGWRIASTRMLLAASRGNLRFAGVGVEGDALALLRGLKGRGAGRSMVTEETQDIVEIRLKPLSRGESVAVPLAIARRGAAGAWKEDDIARDLQDTAIRVVFAGPGGVRASARGVLTEAGAFVFFDDCRVPAQEEKGAVRPGPELTAGRRPAASPR